MLVFSPPVRILDGLGFPEGINFGPDGTLYCVDIYRGNVCIMPPRGELEVLVHTGGGPNGSRLGPDGKLYVADNGLRAILCVDPQTRSWEVVVDEYEGRRFLGPNDLCFAADGTLYFTDPMGSNPSNPIGCVYSLSPQGELRRVIAGLAFPNGIAITPDGGELLVAETHTGILHRYALQQDGTVLEVAPLAKLSPASDDSSGRECGPDGIRFGPDGRLYVAHFGAGAVQVLTLEGEIVCSIPSGGPTPTNLAFWRDALYVTDGTAGSIFRIPLRRS